MPLAGMFVVPKVPATVSPPGSSASDRTAAGARPRSLSVRFLTWRLPMAPRQTSAPEISCFAADTASSAEAVMLGAPPLTAIERGDGKHRGGHRSGH
jgi:hypothetical protein